MPVYIIWLQYEYILRRAFFLVVLVLHGLDFVFKMLILTNARTYIPIVWNLIFQINLVNSTAPTKVVYTEIVKQEAQSRKNNS